MDVKHRVYFRNTVSRFDLVTARPNRLTVFLKVLPLNLAYTFVHFRTLNHRLSIQRGRVMNLPYGDRLCTKCLFADIGDEFHYVFCCPFLFAESRKITFISPFNCKNANVNRFQCFFAIKTHTHTIIGKFSTLF